MRDYIFAYGSLVNNEKISSILFSNLENQFIPCRVHGLKRGWYAQNHPIIPKGGLSRGSTYLGLYEEKDSTCNGILIPVSKKDLKILDVEENIYVCGQINPEAIEIGLGSHLPVRSRFLFYQIKEIKEANPKFPIYQSYLDLVLTGFIQIDTRLGDRDYQFTREFLRTTYGWNGNWINDRVYPARPSAFSPNAHLIDRLLFEEIPLPILSQIQ